MGELDGVRGLVPSNFLGDAPDQYGNQGPTANSVAQRSLNSRGRGMSGPGARGPPPPERNNMNPMGMNQRGGPQQQRRGMNFLFLLFNHIRQNIFQCFFIVLNKLTIFHTSKITNLICVV